MPDYVQLKTDIANWLNRGDLIQDIPSFVSLAEIRMSRRLRTWWLTRMATFTVPSDVVSGTVDFPLPDLFNGFRTLRLNTDPIISLSYIQPEQMNVSNLEKNLRGRTSHFTVIADRLRVAPPPPPDTEIQAVYYLKPLALADNQLTNLFTTNAYDMLLYGALLEAKPFIKDDKRIQTWMTLYSSSQSDIEDDDERLRWGDSALTITSDYTTDPVGTRVATG